MENNSTKNEAFGRVSDLITRLTAIEMKQANDYKSLALVQSKLETLQVISEKLIKIDFGIENLGHIVSKLEQRDGELEDVIDKLRHDVDTNTMNIAETVKELQRVHSRLEGLCGDINTKLDDLKATLDKDYLSNAAFTRLQRNILWAVISFVGALVINFVMNKYAN